MFLLLVGAGPCASAFLSVRFFRVIVRFETKARVAPLNLASTRVAHHVQPTSSVTVDAELLVIKDLSGLFCVVVLLPHQLLGATNSAVHPAHRV
jgi:hypothetical protein